ncbi:MAG: FAD-dependent oxidoreductase, partial [Pseudomonadota bacterium]
MTAPATAPMTAPATAPRIAVVGAGAAGIGAGMALAERGVPFVILEAQDRVGGRAFTDAASLPAPWDHGCGWLHNADVNPLTAEAERRGIDILREVRDAYFMLHEHGAWRDDAETQAARDALAETFGALAEAARDGADRAAAELLDPQAPFARSVRYVLALVEAEDPERVSCAATLDYADNGVNWRALDGYGALVAHLAEGLPIRTGVAASRVAHEGGGVRLTTSAGDLQVEAALVTASANVLLEGGIEIGPGPAREAL